MTAVRRVSDHRSEPVEQQPKNVVALAFGPVPVMGVVVEDGADGPAVEAALRMVIENMGGDFPFGWFFLAILASWRFILFSAFRFYFYYGPLTAHSLRPIAYSPPPCLFPPSAFDLPPSSLNFRRSDFLGDLGVLAVHFGFRLPLSLHGQILLLVILILGLGVLAVVFAFSIFRFPLLFPAHRRDSFQIILLAKPYASIKVRLACWTSC